MKDEIIHVLLDTYMGCNANPSFEHYKYSLEVIGELYADKSVDEVLEEFRTSQIWIDFEENIGIETCLLCGIKNKYKFDKGDVLL